MPARLEKTRTPGVFKRGSRYVFSYRVEGKQRWESCRTLDEARRAKAARATDIEARRVRAALPDHAARVRAGVDGTMLDPDNLATRVLAPACEGAGIEWAGFHTFRHTVASRLFAEGRNVVQVQRWLGRHSASFTLDTYVHLLDNDLGEPLPTSLAE